MAKLLLTFGDSWVYGVGVNYQKNMTEKEYIKDAWKKELCDNLSFRRIIALHMKRTNLNFSSGGSSNQRQFRLAEEFFLAKPDFWFQENDIIVLWGITSIYRNEFFNISRNDYENLNLESCSFGRMILKKYFHDEDEIKKLSGKIKLFNSFFKEKKIKNYWFSVFNEHSYYYDIDNLLFDGKNLLSLLLNNFEKNNFYHKSMWEDTDRNIKIAKQLGLVNPYSLHPTKESHKVLADFFTKEIQD